MHLVFLTHPDFFSTKSMPRFTHMLNKGMKERGHSTEIWTANPYFHQFPVTGVFKKYLGYIDQFILFPIIIRLRLLQKEKTLFVFTDNGLGPWVPYLKNRPHVIHCHDFMAQRSAEGEFEQNPISRMGRIYQMFIRKGFRKGKNFISVSEKTKHELHFFLNSKPAISEVVYNGLNSNFCAVDDKNQALKEVGALINTSLDKGFFLQVGGNQYYKNRKGIIHLYNAWRDLTATPIPLLMVGYSPIPEITKLKRESLYSDDIHFLNDLSDKLLKTAYQGATALLFPSLAEGFGWPIAEAMASGCMVFTTNRPPMTEVGGDAAIYLPLLEFKREYANWAKECAVIVEKYMILSVEEKNMKILKCIENAKRFDTENSLDKIEYIYKSIMQSE